MADTIAVGDAHAGGLYGYARPSNGIAHVNPASVAAAPAQWDGREVEIVGLLVWEFENLGLYQDYGAFCRAGSGPPSTSIGTIGPESPERQPAARRRPRRLPQRASAGPDGTIIVNNAAPGPGPLEPGQVVRWLSPPAKPCPKALP